MSLSSQILVPCLSLCRCTNRRRFLDCFVVDFEIQFCFNLNVCQIGFNILCYVYVLFELRVCFFSDTCFFQNRNTRIFKTAKAHEVSFSFRHWQFTAEVKVAFKCSFNFNTFIKNHSKSHPQSVQKLCRIHDWICVSFETASESNFGGIWDFKIR